jgi:glycyl-tRNA synthetase
MEKLIHFCNRRGFVYSGSKIYGGLRGTFDYGPLGMQMKKNIADLWWSDFVEQRSDCVGLDSSIILHPKVWKTSGHIDEFTDPLTECNMCQQRSRADKLLEDVAGIKPDVVAQMSLNDMKQSIIQHNIPCPGCNSPAEVSFVNDVQNFNLLFTTSLGPTESIQNDNQVYLRPETAQGAYINFSQVVTSLRKRVPFGIGQMGKAFRNEIHPSNFLFRTREFEILELQYFSHPSNAGKEYQYWRKYCFDWLQKYGIDGKNLRYRDYEADEVAHYARATTDIEYNYPSLGWSELWGIADRGDYDLTQHIHGTAAAGNNNDDGTNSKKKQKKKKKQKINSAVGTYFDPVTNEKYVPYIIEPALGLNRAMLAFLCNGWVEEKIIDTTNTVTEEQEQVEEERMYLKLHEDIVPYKCAVSLHLLCLHTYTHTHTQTYIHTTSTTY